MPGLGQGGSAGLPSFVQVRISGRAFSGGGQWLCGSGWVGGVQCVPGVGPGPVFGEVEHGSALGLGESVGYADEAFAQGRAAAGFSVKAAGQAAGGAQQVVADRRAERPAGVGGEPAAG
jgi:hypothetical protein